MSKTAAYTKSAKHFLLAAKHCEIQGLEHLRETCELVTRISQLVHALQKERGLSNGFLASPESRFASQRTEQVQDSRLKEKLLEDFLQQLNLDACQQAGQVRQFTRLAAVLQELEKLPVLRHRIDELALQPEESTSAFTHLIGGLLSIVFEAADASADPEITRQLVAMFNFMQGKELAGQERAWGAWGFASGHFSEDNQQRLSHLLEGQQRCFDLFEQFADTDSRKAWESLLEASAHQELLRLRDVVKRSQGGEGIPTSFSEIWYEVATRRIDTMNAIEGQLAAILKQLSECRIQAARDDLKNHQEVLQHLAQEPTEAPSSFWVEGQMTGVGRSLCELVQTQAQHLQQIQDQLKEARQALDERKLIERAKGLLMQYRRLTEDQAHRQLRKTAMEQNRRLVEVAERVISTVELLQDS
ncbi:nitrate- and nitrite sensing domain-containing protein [Marinospirillum sp.]|uniref:nitrate- and nitrite sensing domain-containing protein n=1 Tax=Marinospirillum sp. TaxID=2183934 RepID=UPI00287090EF|nr:nitrate- and nitrite sensing domain-containing protein [Marinospirillum sp.]MDR9468032.1 nitrate- and nitrite sensing domain-containing protein [Marinospirillum sp.]